MLWCCEKEEDISQYGWFSESSDGYVHPIGLLKPNSNGLYDIHGNVWEWCQDSYDEHYYEKTGSKNPVNDTDDLEKVCRGGSKTGDLAVLTPDKHITIVGRRKEAILLPNGEKISPDLVEASYAKIMGDLQYAVCGVQLTKENEYDTVFMFIEGDFDEKEKADIKQKLFFENGQINENYRISEARFISELPKTSVGKVQRFQLKDIALNNVDNTKTVISNNKGIIKEDDSIEGRVRNCIRECSNLDLSQVVIKNEMNLYNDLGYDSLELYQLSTALEQEFKKDLSDFFTAELTVQDIHRSRHCPRQFLL